MLFFPAAWLLPRPYKSIKKCDAFFFLVHDVLAVTTLQYIPLGITHYNLRWMLLIRLIIRILPPQKKSQTITPLLSLTVGPFSPGGPGRPVSPRSP